MSVSIELNGVGQSYPAPQEGDPDVVVLDGISLKLEAGINMLLSLIHI